MKLKCVWLKVCAGVSSEMLFCSARCYRVLIWATLVFLSAWTHLWHLYQQDALACRSAARWMVSFWGGFRTVVCSNFSFWNNHSSLSGTNKHTTVKRSQRSHFQILDPDSDVWCEQAPACCYILCCCPVIGWVSRWIGAPDDVSDECPL